MLVGRVEDVERIVSEFNCNIGSLPTECLGLPLGAKHKTARVWDGVEERFRRRTALWKSHHISNGGRLTLIRSALSNMPTYLMSLFRLPKGVKLRPDKIQRDFLWGEGSLERKFHLINWKSICHSKEKGGLGSRNLSIFNKALFRKWSWRFTMEDSFMWKSVINMKYGTMERGWFPPLPKGYNGVSLWKEISKEGMLLNQHYSVKLGDGIKARF